MKNVLNNLTREEWLIRLMQGMVGTYGSNKDTCYYDNGKFVAVDSNDVRRLINLDIVHSTYSITNTKSIDIAISVPNICE